MRSLKRFLTKNSLREIFVQPPIKTPQRFEVKYHAYNGRKGSLRHALAAAYHRRWPLHRPMVVESCGFIARNFEIQHSELWDSVVPLLYLTRNGGPLYMTNFSRGNIVFEYPILSRVRDFFVHRAAQFGLNITIDAETYETTVDLPSQGDAVPLGGGKDGRLIYGILKELGRDPLAFTATGTGEETIKDIDVHSSIPLTPHHSFLMGVVSALMSPCKKIHLGTGVTETVLSEPWQEYYDFTRDPLTEFHGLLRSYGVEKEILVPLSVLAPNVTQSILAKRYPNLFKHQYSTSPNKLIEKNLHISLIKAYHGLDFESHCSIADFKRLLKDFTNSQLSHRGKQGFRNHRLYYRAEMKSIIYRMQEHSLFQDIRGNVPQSWDADWIDYIHTNRYPEVETGFLEVFRDYAQEPHEGDACFPVPS